MSQAILISDNEVINSLYEVNLRVYVGTNVTIKKSLDAAIDLIEHSPNVDAVICFRELNKADNAIETFHTFLKSKNLQIPVIVLGEPNKPLDNSIIIKNKYDIKGLLQSMAKILEISAADMAHKSVPKFFPIPLKLFSQLESTHCDIFYRTRKESFEYEYFKIIEKDANIGENLQKYIQEGVEHLFIDAGERLRFINKASGAVISELDRDDLTIEERTEITQQGMGIVAEEIFESDEISMEVAAISRACIESINQVCNSVPKLKNLLSMLLESKSEYCYKHSVLTTYIASQIIKNISWGSAEQQNKVAFSLFFHDIYLVPVFKKYPDVLSEEDLLFRDDVEDKDKEVILNHAKLAGQLIKTFPRCPMGADMIITQHHGMTSGQGFATNYKDDISPLSKIMIVAEDICASILATCHAETGKMNIDKEKITKDLAAQYRNHSYKKIILAFMDVKL